TQRQDAGGPGEQEAPRPRVGVDRELDGPEEFRRELHLVDDEQPVVLDEAGPPARRPASRGRPGGGTRRRACRPATILASVLLPAWRAPLTLTTRVSRSASATRGSAFRRSRSATVHCGH